MLEEMIVFLTAALPISELRGSIPLGLVVYGFSVTKTYIISVLGNIFPIIFLIYFLESMVKLSRQKIEFVDLFFDQLFTRTQKKYTYRFQLFGALALITLVAIPLPFTGAWTGAIAAFVFAVPKYKALLYIFLGILIAGIIVSILTLGIFDVYKFFIKPSY
jgi:uncharacterized membrane protein